jgi:hypothetical protein
MTPYYHKGEISSNKPDLPFGLAEIYRYVWERENNRLDL